MYESDPRHELLYFIQNIFSELRTGEGFGGTNLTHDAPILLSKIIFQSSAQVGVWWYESDPRVPVLSPKYFSELRTSEFSLHKIHLFFTSFSKTTSRGNMGTWE